MTALPMALRERFQSLIEEGSSARGAARRLKLSAATGERWAQQGAQQANAPDEAANVDELAVFYAMSIVGISMLIRAKAPADLAHVAAKGASACCRMWFDARASELRPRR